MIPYSRQSIDKSDISAVTKVLKSNYLTQGPYIEKFENEFKKFCKAKFSTSVNSATSALHLSCIALGLKKNDYLWTSPISFVASSNCALYCGAKVDFIDIDIKTFNLDINILSQKLIKARKNNKLPKILVVVHMGGASCEMKEIRRLSNKYNFKIIEDASHCTGSKYRNLPVGNCKYSDITVMSFHPVKIITTGEGGMILTNKKILDTRVKILRTSGIQKNLTKAKFSKNGNWFYEQLMLGYNYRMNDLSAALGLSQLKKVNKFVKKRNEIAKIYFKNLKNYPIKFQLINKKIISSYHLFLILVEKSIRKKLFNVLRKHGYYVNIHYIPIHLQPYYKKLGFKKGMFPMAEKYYNQTLSIPIFPDFKKKDQINLIKIIKKTVKNY